MNPIHSRKVLLAIISTRESRILLLPGLNQVRSCLHLRTFLDELTLYSLLARNGLVKPVDVTSHILS